MSNPFRHLKARVRQWFLNRVPLADSLTLTQRNVYILPTRAGLMLGVTVLVLLVASINYQLNLGYLLTFLLAGCALVAMHVSHANLRGVRLNLIAPSPVFARDTCHFSVAIDNPRQRNRYAVDLSVADTEQWVSLDVPAQSSASAALAWRAPERGWHRLPTLTARTLFPLGTFRVWAVWRPAAQLLVYPAPESSPPPLPVGMASSGTATTPVVAHQPGEPDGLRPYRRGDALKNILWKKAASTGALVSRDSVTLQSSELWLERHNTGLSQPEAQLSRLCAWVLRADTLGLRYGLRLQQEIAPNSGPQHLQRCLQALALA